MRFAMILLALGLVMGVPIAPTSVMNKAEAQAAIMTMEEQTLQAQIVALAQAGNTDGIKALIRTKIAQGKGAMVAKVAKAIAAMGANLAATDPASAAALVNAAITIVIDPSVAAADSTAESAVGASAAYAVATMNANPAGGAANAASIQSAVANSGNNSIQAAYNSGGSRNQQLGGTQQLGGGTTTTMRDVGRPNLRVTRPPRPRIPRNTVIPIPIEPNPAQAGSPT